MLFAVILDYLGAGIGFVAQNAAPGLLAKFPNHILREAVGIGGKRFGADKPGDFPMADGGVFSVAALLQAGKCTGRGVCRRATANSVNVEQPQLDQIGGSKGGAAGYRAQGIYPVVAEFGGIRLFPNAKTVQNDQKHPLCHIVSGSFHKLPPRGRARKPLARPAEPATFLYLLYRILGEIKMFLCNLPMNKMNETTMIDFLQVPSIFYTCPAGGSVYNKCGISRRQAV